MKKAIISVLLTFLIIGTGAGVGKKPLCPEKSRGQLTPDQALERAKELWKNKNVKSEYAAIFGPYFVLSLSKDFNSGYLLYFLKKDRIILAEVMIDAYGKKGNDYISFFNKVVVKIDDLLLDGTKVKERFRSEKELELILFKMVHYISFWGGFLPHAPVVWWLIDENGQCYSMSLNGDLISFKELHEQRKNMKGVNVIIDNDLDTLFSDTTEVKKRFQSVTGLEVISIRKVSPKKMKELKAVQHLPEVWYIIDTNGDHYYMTLTGNIHKLKLKIKKDIRQ